jgi:pimeloyl-ACP methyl ester carboxylesterase
MILAIVAGVYLTLCVGLTLTQRSLIYHPCREKPAALVARAKAHGFENWQSAHGEFMGWKRLSKTRPAIAGVLILHGNAGCALDWTHYADGLQRSAALDVYLLEYPGYGGRPGSPSQESLFRSGTAALQALDSVRRVYLVGESLGTGVAAYLAGSFPDRVSAVLLVAPFNNLSAVAQHHLKIFPARCMLRDKFRSDRWLRHYSGPVGFLLAGRDRVVPIRFGRRLYHSYAGPKRLWVMPHAGHEDLHERAPDWWKEALDFLGMTNAPSPCPLTR